MRKEIFDQFIRKYGLDKSVESVTWHSDGNEVSVAGSPQDTQVIVFANTEEITLPPGDYPIFETSQLQSFLKVLDDDIGLEVLTTDNDTPIAFKMEDSHTEILFKLSDESAIPSEPKEADLEPFDMTIEFDQEFMERFMKAKSALSDLDVFSVMQDGGDNTSFVLGHDQGMLTSNISLDVESSGSIGDDLVFSANYLDTAFRVNKKEATGGTIKISNRGIMLVTFDDDSRYDVRYYFVKIKQNVI